MTPYFRHYLWLLLWAPYFFSLHAQPFQTHARIEDDAFDRVVRKYLDFSVPLIDVDSVYRYIQRDVKGIYILDARAREEYEVSHLPHAEWIGYPHIEVYNLYGSLFEWINRGYPVVDLRGDTVRRVHTYNRKWSRWVLNSSYEKVY